ncbi:c-type cytochrome biogenesis protein CcmI [Martelella alba]|uniref:C-type cytochrome biogenesis protein CcmI n=1 Tax=Martelella alba TaxID=2590451 RepID=A0ABY2SG92_9HYPH|nr:c-type cytochrome biogenesis protein CcmI [Martelella alba]TKI03861.1 c-type cytochrome biogenesis protein CcmI [Martelella alba]
MIAWGAVALVLLILAAGLLVLPAVGNAGQADLSRRDALNADLYLRRLDELKRDEAQGLIGERAAHIAEWQRNLLADASSCPPPVRRGGSLGILLPGAIGLVVVTLMLYGWTGGLRQVWLWQRIVAEQPALRARLADPSARPLSPEALSHFAIGLRAELARRPDNLPDWLILSRVGLAMHNPAMAAQALAQARRLAPNDESIALDYADALSRSDNPGDNQQGIRVLQSLLARRPDNPRAVGLLALSRYQQGDFVKAIALWQRLLTLLPAADPHVSAIERGIAQAREQAGLEKAGLIVTVGAAMPVRAKLPRQGWVVVTVTDGQSSSPVAVKTLPLSRFPLSLSLDDSNAVTPEHLLSALRRLTVRVRISPDDAAERQTGEWFGESALAHFAGAGRIAVQIDQQVP